MMRLPRGVHIVMNFSVRNMQRKWSCRGVMSGAAGMVSAVAAMLALSTQPLAARKHSALPNDASPTLQRGLQLGQVPVPRPRPAEAPSGHSERPPDEAKEAKTPPAEPAAPQVSACRMALTENIAIAPSIPDIHDPGGCGGEDLVRLEAVVLPDKRRVLVRPAATMRCGMATAVAEWVRSDLSKIAETLGSPISSLDNFDSYECRGRNRVAGAKLSEHGRANALDVRGFALASGQSISLIDRSLAREVREAVLHSACARFSTVLGPGSDGYHEDHIHLDTLERRNNYRICQWDVWDALPGVAPLLPPERPEEAPPREVAAKNDGKGQSAAPDHADEAGPEPQRPESGKPAQAEIPRPEKATTKKRRQSRRL